jgi:hypothetical protein
MGGGSGLVTPDSLSREPSPDGLDSDMGVLMGPPASSFLTMPHSAEFKLSSKSAPGSPGGSGQFSPAHAAAADPLISQNCFPDQVMESLSPVRASFQDQTPQKYL